MEAKEFQTVCTSPLLTTHFSVAWSGDDHVSLVTEKGLHVMEIVPSPTSPTPKLTLKRWWHKPNLALPTENADLDYNAMMCSLDRDKTYQLILDTTLSPALDGASPISPRYTYSAWSPHGMLYYGRCLLATLTNMGAVKIEYMYNRRWYEVADMSGCWVDHCRARWSGVEKLSVDEQFKVLCSRAKQLRTVAISWSSLRGTLSDCYCLLAMAQRDGMIAVWKIGMVRVVVGHGLPTEHPDPELLATLPSELNHISVLLWPKLESMTGFLVAGDKSGVVSSWSVTEDISAKIDIAGDTGSPTPITFGTRSDLYETSDRMEVTHIDLSTMPGNHEENLVVVTKANILLVILVDDDWKVVELAVHRFQDIAITGIVVFKPGHFVVSTRSGNLHYVEAVWQKSENTKGIRLGLSTSAVRSNINLTHNACFGMAASEHKMLWIMATSVNKMYDHLILRQPTNMIFFTLSNTAEALPLLVENSTNQLTRYWDCLEVIRIQCQKFGHRPPIDVTVEDLDPLNSYQLRLSLWLTVIGLTVSTDLDTEASSFLTDIYRHTRELIFARHACDRVEHMLSSVVSKGSLLTEEELSCINLLRIWLLNFNEQGNATTSWTTTCARVSNILSGSQGLEELIKEYCAICESEVEKTSLLEDRWFFASCSNGHSIPRCTASLLPCVILPYYTCRICQTPTHGSFVTATGPLCVYCDCILRPEECIGPSES